jgi:hypothetical protein
MAAEETASGAVFDTRADAGAKKKNRNEYAKAWMKRRRATDKEYCAKNLKRTQEWLRKPDSHKKILLVWARSRAKKNGIFFDINHEDLTWPTHCPVLGIELIYGARNAGTKYRDNSPSIDRIDPSIGYVKGNVMVISFRANAMKRNATAHELVLLGEHGKRLLARQM